MAQMPKPMSGAERQAADLLAQAISSDFSSTLGFRVKAFQMDVEEALADTRKVLEAALAKHNLPVKLNLHIGLEIDNKGIQEEMSKRVQAAFKGELTEEPDNMTLY